MSKEIFRYLRGELNGFYIRKLQDMMNGVISDIKDLFAYFRYMQFDLQHMTDEDIYNLGKFAGVFLPSLSYGDLFGAFKMTDSHIVEGEERSERGLLNRETESFNFVHTEQDDYPDDINTLATVDNKSSFIGTETEIGYVSSEEEDVLDAEGNVKPSAVLPVAPQDEAYTDFYGNQFTFLAEVKMEKRNISIRLFYPLFKIMQSIRYNGVSIETLAEVFEVLCPEGFVTIQSIQKHTIHPVFIVNYIYNEDSPVNLKAQRFATLEYVIAQKFPQIILNAV